MAAEIPNIKPDILIIVSMSALHVVRLIKQNFCYWEKLLCCHFHSTLVGINVSLNKFNFSDLTFVVQLHFLAVKCIDSVLKSEMLGYLLNIFVWMNCPKFVDCPKGCTEMGWPQAFAVVTTFCPIAPAGLYIIVLSSS